MCVRLYALSARLQLNRYHHGILLFRSQHKKKAEVGPELVLQRREGEKKFLASSWSFGRMTTGMMVSESGTESRGGLALFTSARRERQSKKREGVG